MLFSILLWVVVIALVKLVNRGREKARQRAENAEISDFPSLDDERVHQIVKTAHLDLKRQGAGAYGPWLATLLDGGQEFYFTGAVDKMGRDKAERVWKRVGPSVALTAIRFTLRDLAGSRFDLAGLLRAEAELEQMEAGE